MCVCVYIILCTYLNAQMCFVDDNFRLYIYVYRDIHNDAMYILYTCILIAHIISLYD